MRKGCCRTPKTPDYLPLGICFAICIAYCIAHVLMASCQTARTKKLNIASSAPPYTGMGTNALLLLFYLSTVVARCCARWRRGRPQSADCSGRRSRQERRSRLQCVSRASRVRSACVVRRASCPNTSHRAAAAGLREPSEGKKIQVTVYTPN